MLEQSKTCSRAAYVVSLNVALTHWARIVTINEQVESREMLSELELHTFCERSLLNIKYTSTMQFL